jgi:hypothetical protein
VMHYCWVCIAGASTNNEQHIPTGLILPCSNDLYLLLSKNMLYARLFITGWLFVALELVVTTYTPMIECRSMCLSS